MENPYKAPTTPVKLAPPPRPRSPILAVLAGIAVHLGGTMASTLVTFLVYWAPLAGQGKSPVEISEALVAADRLSPYLTVSGVIAFGLSVLGGYVCARVARRQERRWAAIAGLILGAIVLIPGGVFSRALLSLVGFMLGGELGRRRNLEDARAAGVASAV